MNKSIAETFKEKNLQILINKIMLDLDNNDDSLKLTINNKMSLLCIKFSQRINNFFKDNNINSYEFKTISEIFNNLSIDMNEYILELLKERKEFIREKINETNIDDLEKLNNLIDETVNVTRSNLEVNINEKIYIDLFNNITKYVIFDNESQKEELINKLKKMDTELTDSIITSITERNTSLKNVMKETKNKVDDINKKTAEQFDK